MNFEQFEQSKLFLHGGKSVRHEGGYHEHAPQRKPCEARRQPENGSEKAWKTICHRPDERVRVFVGLSGSIGDDLVNEIFSKFSVWGKRSDQGVEKS